MKRPLVVNIKNARVTLDCQIRIDDQEDVTINITGKEDNSISSSEEGQDETAEISSGKEYEDG